MARQLEAKHAAGPPRPHGLPGPLIISLTSYSPRFPTLHLTLRSLLRQSVRPDGIVLWIAHSDMHHLPRAVRRLERPGLEIRACDDLRSYKKLIPALTAFPDAYLATADDDLYFEPDWLAHLAEAYVPSERVILARRVHRIVAEMDGRLASYSQREKDVQDARARMPSFDLIPTTGAGVLFAPGLLPPEAGESSLALELCPDADDLWFWWHARRAGVPARKAGPMFPLLTWHGSQTTALEHRNVYAGGNDRQIKALEDHYGPMGGVM